MTDSESYVLPPPPPEACPTPKEARTILGIGKIAAKRHLGELGKDVRLAPLGVLAIAEHLEVESLNEVAQNLLEYATGRSPESVELVKCQLEEFFKDRRTPHTTTEKLLDEVRQGGLPGHIVASAERAYSKYPDPGTTLPPAA